MKRISLVLCFVLLISACSLGSENKENANSEAQTIEYNYSDKALVLDLEDSESWPEQDPFYISKTGTETIEMFGDKVSFSVNKDFFISDIYVSDQDKSVVRIVYDNEKNKTFFLCLMSPGDYTDSDLDMMSDAEIYGANRFHIFGDNYSETEYILTLEKTDFFVIVDKSVSDSIKTQFLSSIKASSFR